MSYFRCLFNEEYQSALERIMAANEEINKERLNAATHPVKDVNTGKNTNKEGRSSRHVT